MKARRCLAWLLIPHALAIATAGTSAATPARRPDAASPPTAAYAPIHPPADDGQVAEIDMFVGETRVFPAPGVARIAVGNGALLTASALDRREVILFANAAGTSSLFLWNEDGHHQRVKITIVPGDTSRHAREIAAFLTTIPKAHASIVGANIIVEGDELSDADLAKIDELAKRYPQIVNFTNRVGWEKTVLLDVKVVEFPASVLRDVGLAWSPTGGAAVAGLWAPARRGQGGPYDLTIRSGSDNAVPVTGPAGTPAGLPSGLQALALLNIGLNAQLQLLAQEGKASLLAQPQLSARNGSRASFLAGGEIPYAVATRDGTAIQFKPYGVRLEITPRVDRRGIIRANIQTEVSGIDRSVTTAGGPALLSRKTETEFNLHDGETLVIAGLLQRDVSHDIDKVPVLGDLPVLGALFRSQRFQKKETELVVFVTPTVVEADTPALADRVRRARERLEDAQGQAPTLPVPAPRAPPAPVAKLAVPTPATAAREAGGSRLIVVADGTPLRAQAHADAALLLVLDAGATVRLAQADATAADSTQEWRHVVVGAASGWVPAVSVRPQAGLPQPLVPPPSGTSAMPRRYRVDREGLALHTTPDVNAEVLVRLSKGQHVTDAGVAPRGAWIAVHAGDGASAPRGWMAAQWLAPLPEEPGSPPP